jgi:hypothetical protein
MAVSTIDALYNGTSEKLTTSATGITVTGNATFADNGKAIFGAGSDLQIYHDGSASRIVDAGTGSLKIQAENFAVNNVGDTENMITAIPDGAVSLFYDGSTKLATTATGVDVTGTVTSTGLIANVPTNTGLTINSTDVSAIQFNVANGSQKNWGFASTLTAAGDFGLYQSNSNGGNPVTAGTARLYVDATGSVLIGSTADDPIARANSAIELAPEGYINVNRDSNISAFFGRSGSDGQIVDFYKGTSNAGTIGRGGSGFFIAGVASSSFGVVFDGSGLISCNGTGVLRDNQYNIGHGSYRWTNIYATNGSINTSDQTEKQDIASLTATEMLVAKRISAMFKNYRWKDKVATEGDGARNHTGIIAQDVQAAFTAESLDASKYGLFCSDTWWETQTDVPAVEAVAEVTDEDGNVTTEAVEAVDAYTRTDTYDTEAEAPEGATSKTRLGIRYPELLSFVAAYNEQRFASIEARLTALEA